MEAPRTSDAIAGSDSLSLEKLREADRLYLESLSRTSGMLGKIPHVPLDPFGGLSPAAKHAYLSRASHLPLPPLPPPSLFDRPGLLPPNPLAYGLDPLLMSPALWTSPASSSSAASMLEQLTRRDQLLLLERQRDAMLAQRSVLDRESLIEYERRVMSGAAAGAPRENSEKPVSGGSARVKSPSAHATNNNYNKHLKSSVDGRRSRAAVSPPSRALPKSECERSTQPQHNGRVSSSPTPDSSLGAPPPLIPANSSLPDSIQTPPDSIKLDTVSNAADCQQSLTVNASTQPAPAYTHLSLGEGKQVSPSVNLVNDAPVRSSDVTSVARPVNGLNQELASLTAATVR